MMALKCLVFCLFILVSGCYGSYVAPKIVKDSDEITINAGENYNLTCQGSRPLTWISPKVTDKQKEQWTSFETDSSRVPHNDDYIYRSVLHITNMSYPFVGFYKCLYENENNEENDQIYLYVNDSEHLSVEDNYTIIYAALHQETTIPCRPTNPNIQVELTSYGTDDIEKSYNPKTGFTFMVTDLSFEDTYNCYFVTSNGEKDFDSIIFLKVNPARDTLATPFIEDLSNNHTDVGQILNLTCYLQETSRNIHFEWKTPRGTFSDKDVSEQIKANVKVDKSRTKSKNDNQYLISNLHIYETNLQDAGTYACEVRDRQNHASHSEVFVMVHDINDCFIEIREENNQVDIEVIATEDVQWILEVQAHPVPELTWFDTQGNQIQNDTMYHTDMTSGKAVFRIKNTSLENDGTYRVHGKVSRDYMTSRCPKEVDFQVKLNVFDKPFVCLDTQNECMANQPPKIYSINEAATVMCNAKGNPLPEITWEYKECLDNGCRFIERKGSNEVIPERFVKTSYLQINTTQGGIVRCVAFNRFGNEASTMKYYISDVKNGFDIIDFSDGAIINKNKTETEVIVATNSTMAFTCAVSPMKSKTIEVFKNDELLNAKYISNYSTEKLSRKLTVSLDEAKPSDNGLYSCRIRNIYDQTYEYKNISISVEEPQSPTIWETNLNEEVLIDYPNMPYELFCNYSGIPQAEVDWYKDNQLIRPSNRIIFKEKSSILKFVKTAVSDEGDYRCDVVNAIGRDYREASLKFKVKPVSLAVYYYITGAIGLLLLAAVIYIIIKVRKERALRRELKLLGLENFHKGNPENLNPELGIDDQAELLPYNKKWEFPIDQLKLGKQLGSGAFGVVMKAEARGIVEGEEKTTVAVKMVKKNADQSYIKALASELKIMVHLGKHINVVNLLGACTKNVAKRELLVIVEFCRFGNLQNYLYKHRESFINQVDPMSGKIDYDVGADLLERSYSVSSEQTNYATTTRSMRDYRERDSAPINSAATQLTSMGDDAMILSNNSVQPEWRLNYRGDYKGYVKPVCTADLVIWSFQVARGMEYLASRKVLHGDLATRNILLADNNIVKICDFGLAKTMYNDNNYKKKGNSPLPVKWMAIESIRDRVFSTQSDVWSFGIVLWELFSLARTPYPGMEADERLFYKLVEGYRMESPVYAPKDIYQLMLDCWDAKPLARPTFTRLVEKIGTLLEDSVQKHYIHLNDPYLKMNTDKLDESDYLAMLSPPSFDILSTPPPHYVNMDGTHGGPSEPKSPGPEGYLFMGSNAIFSPRGDGNEVFDFSGSRRQGSEPKKEHQELRPMLHSYNNESDSETGYLTPISPNSVSNPSYLLPPTVHSDNMPRLTESVRTPDNYITMPQYKNLVNSNFKDRFSDSPVKLGTERDKENVHYVNNPELWNSVDV